MTWLEGWVVKAQKQRLDNIILQHPINYVVMVCRTRKREKRKAEASFIYAAHHSKK